MAVGIERGEENEHHVAQRAQDFRILRRRQRMQQFGRGLGRADLSGVNAHADGDEHRLARRQRQGCRLLESSRIGEPQGVGANLLEPRDVLGRRHDRGDQPPAVG